MAEVVSCEWLLENVGKPTNSFGSKYSAVYKALESYEKAKTPEGLVKVGKLAMLWCQSKHKNATTPEARELKKEQQLRLNRFISFLNAEISARNPDHKRALLLQMKKDDTTYAKEKAMVEAVIDEMADSAVPILKNTGKALRGRPIVMSFNDKVNGSITNGVITINAVLAYHQSELQGVLVHECHHMLCIHNGNYTYLDEFVAHMKQYTLVRPKMTEAEMVATVHKLLNGNYAGIVTRWTDPVAKHGMGMRLVETFADLGDFAVPDNAARIDCVKHGCAPAP